MRILFLSRRFPIVRLGYVTQVSDRKGLGKRRTGTRQDDNDDNGDDDDDEDNADDDDDD